MTNIIFLVPHAVLLVSWHDSLEYPSWDLQLFGWNAENEQLFTNRNHSKNIIRQIVAGISTNIRKRKSFFISQSSLSISFSSNSRTFPFIHFVHLSSNNRAFLSRKSKTIKALVRARRLIYSIIYKFHFISPMKLETL